MGFLIPNVDGILPYLPDSGWIGFLYDWISTYCRYLAWISLGVARRAFGYPFLHELLLAGKDNPIQPDFVESKLVIYDWIHSHRSCMGLLGIIPKGNKRIL
jgi:hypothetical protein